MSGEHSVVYGCPALALALDRHATATVSVVDHPGVVIRLGDRTPVSWTLDEISTQASELDARHRRFLDNQCAIESVLQSPEALFAYCAAQVFQARGLPAHGLRLDLHTDIPPGCGMGSSAALILASLRALALHRGEALPDERALGLCAEHLQHGRSSGLDIHASALGGMIRFADGVGEALPAPAGPLLLAHTGIPEVSTGVCVQAVREAFAGDQALWQAFADCTNAFTQLVSEGRMDALRETIMENHQLLVHIGVVPERVQAFIREVEAGGGAGKICGAGSIKGDAAGAVFVYGAGETAEALMAKWNYKRLEMGLATHGTQAS